MDDEWASQKARDIIAWQIIHDSGKLAETMKKDIIQALEESFTRGMRHVTVPRDLVSVHGTDDCLNCDTGRITLYAASRWCVECQHKKAHAEGERADDRR